MTDKLSKNELNKITDGQQFVKNVVLVCKERTRENVLSFIAWSGKIHDSAGLVPKNYVFVAGYTQCHTKVQGRYEV